MPTIQPRPEKNSATFSLMHVSWQHTNGARNQKRNAQPHLAHPEGMSRGHAVLLKKSNDSIPRILTFHQSRLTSSMTRLRARHNQHLWRHARQHYTHKPLGLQSNGIVQGELTLYQFPAPMVILNTRTPS